MNKIWIQTLVTIGMVLGSFPALAQRYVWDVDRIAPEFREIRLQDTAGTTVYYLNARQLEALKESRARIQNVARMHVEKLFIIDGDKTNAFSGYGKEGSFVAFNTKMLDAIGNDKDAMAAIMGHEIAHLKLNHIQHRQDANSIIEVIGLVVGLAVEIAAQSKLQVRGVGSMVESLGTLMASTAFSRDQEREADDLGTRWAASAGYSPKGAARFHRKLLDLNNTQTIPFLSTHPSSRERVETLEKLAVELSRFQAPLAQITLPKPEKQHADNIVLGQTIPGPAQAYIAHCRSVGHHCNPRIQMAVGYFYFTGRGVPVDYSEAMKWFRLAADQENVHAQVMIGLLHQEGLGVLRNYTEAMRWFLVAANQGYAPAQNKVGVLYSQGLGASKNCTIARQWLEKAASGGDQQATHLISSGVNGTCQWW